MQLNKCKLSLTWAFSNCVYSFVYHIFHIYSFLQYGLQVLLITLKLIFKTSNHQYKKCYDSDQKNLTANFIQNMFGYQPKNIISFPCQWAPTWPTGPGTFAK